MSEDDSTLQHSQAGWDVTYSQISGYPNGEYETYCFVVCTVV